MDQTKFVTSQPHLPYTGLLEALVRRGFSSNQTINEWTTRVCRVPFPRQSLLPFIRVAYLLRAPAPQPAFSPPLARSASGVPRPASLPFPVTVFDASEVAQTRVPVPLIPQFDPNFFFDFCLVRDLGFVVEFRLEFLGSASDRFRSGGIPACTPWLRRGTGVTGATT